MKNVEQCPTRYILDLNMGNVKVKIQLKKSPKVKLRVTVAPWKGKSKASTVKQKTKMTA